MRGGRFRPCLPGAHVWNVWHVPSAVVDLALAAFHSWSCPCSCCCCYCLGGLFQYLCNGHEPTGCWAPRVCPHLEKTASWRGYFSWCFWFWFWFCRIYVHLGQTAVHFVFFSQKKRRRKRKTRRRRTTRRRRMSYLVGGNSLKACRLYLSPPGYPCHWAPAAFSGSSYRTCRSSIVSRSRGKRKSCGKTAKRTAKRTTKTTRHGTEKAQTCRATMIEPLPSLETMVRRNHSYGMTRACQAHARQARHCCAHRRQARHCARPHAHHCRAHRHAHRHARHGQARRGHRAGSSVRPAGFPAGSAPSWAEGYLAAACHCALCRCRSLLGSRPSRWRLSPSSSASPCSYARPF